MPQWDSERWLAACEAQAALGGVDPNDLDFWQTGGDWIDAERRSSR